MFHIAIRSGFPCKGHLHSWLFAEIMDGKSSSVPPGRDRRHGGNKLALTVRTKLAAVTLPINITQERLERRLRVTTVFIFYMLMLAACQFVEMRSTQRQDSLSIH